MTFNDEQLYERMVATLLASWERYAEGTAEASVDRIPGAAIARFPAGPERFVYNNAVIERRLDDSTAADAVRATVEAYREVGIGAYAVWAHESEQAAIAELVRRGF